MPYNENGHLTDASGNAYVWTHEMATEREMVESLSHYVGHSMYAFWGEKRTLVRLESISGTSVRVYSFRTGNTIVCSAFDAFGSYCTTVQPKKETAELARLRETLCGDPEKYRAGGLSL